ncbi:hypothetical protein OXX79_000170 [Metschnikowia pulcherrima]
MKFAASALLLSGMAAASPVNTTESTVTTTVSTTQTFYTTVWQVCTVSAPASISDVTQTISKVSASSSAHSAVSPVSVVSSSSLEKSIVSASSFQSVATASAASSSVKSATTTASTSEASATPKSSFAGDGTWYYTGLGACGWVNTDQDYIVAIGHGLFDQYTPGTNPNENTLCGKKIRAHYQGKSVEVTAVDRCEGCKPYDIDFSPAAFSQLADQSVGRIKITWEWI